MKRWFRKIAVVLITIMTLGMYVPPTYFHTEVDESKDNITSKEDGSKEIQAMEDEGRENILHLTMVDELPSQAEIIQQLTEKAKEQVVVKLGPKIMNEVNEEFNGLILPPMESVLQTLLTEDEEDALPYYGITEHPTAGIGEKIFNVYDMRTENDLARFHVRRDNRPQEGYWFNFHYHVSKDNFEEHHEIGEIYWDKNTPPRWMSS